jgi:peptidoglycan biosynthesis protein MviN/MurJ (putative lipid II flippase)
VAEGLGNLALSIALVKSMGIIGVAWGTAIPNLAVSIFFWPWYSRRTLGIPIRDYMRSLWLLPAATILPFGICTYLVDRFWPVRTLLLFFVQVAAILPVAFVCIWFLGLTADERSSFDKWFKSSSRAPHGQS